MAGFFITCLLVAASSFQSASASATCYREDNHQAASAIYAPCNTNIPYSMCYRSQPASSGTPADHSCFENGLVLNINAQGEYQYWRRSCSDETWNSPYCQHAFDKCTSETNGNVQVTPCNGNGADTTTWCCGSNNTDCCSGNTAITIGTILGPSSVSLTSSSSSASATTMSTSSTSSMSATTTSAIASTPTPSSSSSSGSQKSASSDQSSSGGLSAGADAGIAIAAIAGAAAIVALIWLVLRRRKRNPEQDSGDNSRGNFRHVEMDSNESEIKEIESPSTTRAETPIALSLPIMRPQSHANAAEIDSRSLISSPRTQRLNSYTSTAVGSQSDTASRSSKTPIRQQSRREPTYPRSPETFLDTGSPRRQHVADFSTAPAPNSLYDVSPKYEIYNPLAQHAPVELEAHHVQRY